MSKISKISKKQPSKKIKVNRKGYRSEMLIANIRKYPTNIAAAIRLTAGQTRTTPSTIQYLWYGSPGKNIKGLRTEKAAFITVTTEGMAQLNTKNSPVLKATKKKLTLEAELMTVKGMTIEMKASVLDILLGN